MANTCWTLSLSVALWSVYNLLDFALRCTILTPRFYDDQAAWDRNLDKAVGMFLQIKVI